MRRWGEAIALGAGLGLAIAILITWTRVGGSPVDAWCYYGLEPSNPYDPNGCFVYSPPVAQLITLLQPVVSFEAFYTTIRTLDMIALALLSGPAIGPLMAVPAVQIELNAANVNLLLVGAVILGFRYPATWAFVILTKVTPGVGLLWFAVRREWRSLGIALGLTGLISAISFLAAPWMWADYLATLTAAGDWSPIHIYARLPIAALLVIWGARTDHRWTLVVATFLALPRWAYLSPVILVGLFPLVRLPRPLPTARFAQGMSGLRRRQPAAATPGSSVGRTVRAPSS